MFDKQKSGANPFSINLPTVTLVAVLLMVALGAFAFLTGDKENSESLSFDQAGLNGSEYPPQPLPTQGHEVEESYNEIAPAVGEQGSDAASLASDDVSRILGIRAVGDPSAPVKIEEFSSLTCPHCASFHEKIYGPLKEKYIDTGKVYFVFGDFPLNKPALDASITARCMPEATYETFLNLLFKTQRQWAAEGYLKALRQNAKLAGLSDEEFDFCLENEEVRNGIAQARQKAADKYNIQSTPTFVFNEGAEQIKGTASLAAFDQVIEKLLQQSEDQ